MGIKFSKSWRWPLALALAVAGLGLSATGVQADTWNGSGFAGGTGDNAWLTDANWLDGTRPTASDDVTLTLNTGSAPNPAVDIAAGAVAHDVTATGLTTTNNRIIQVTGDPLHNMSGVALILGDQANPTPTTAKFDGGTFRAIRALLHVTQARTPTMTAQGDFTIVGQEAGNAVFVSRKNAGSSSTLHLNGFDMTVSSAAPVVIGDPVSAGTSDAATSVLNMIGSTVTVAGDFTVGLNGILRSDAGTVLKLAGDFFINTAKNLTASEYNMTSATVVLNGDEKQRFEVHGIDNGTTPLANNFAIGSLVIGEGGSPTFVELTDLFDYGGGTPTAPTPNGLARRAVPDLADDESGDDPGSELPERVRQRREAASGGVPGRVRVHPRANIRCGATGIWRVGHAQT